MACNTPLWPLLGLMGVQIGPDPINRLVPTCPSTYVCFSPNHIWSALVETFPTLYFIYARRQGLKINCAESQDFWSPLDYCVTKTKIGSGSESCSWHEYTAVVSPSQPRRMGFPPNISWTPWWVVEHGTNEKYTTNISWTPWWVVEHGTNEKYTTLMASSFKKTK